jgi:hypothetical protein
MIPCTCIPETKTIYQMPINVPNVHVTVIKPTGRIPMYTMRSCHNLRPNRRF